MRREKNYTNYHQYNIVFIHDDHDDDDKIRCEKTLTNNYMSTLHTLKNNVMW